MTNQAFFGEPAEIASAVVGASFTLTGPEAHHAARVKRVAAGESVDILDGEGCRLSGTVTVASAESVTLTVDSIGRDPLPEHRIVLVQALAKGDRAELAVEAATELGVDAVVPWQADRSIVRWRAEKVLKGKAKWEFLVRAASKQSRRTRVPDVLDVQDGRGLASWLGGIEQAVVLHEGAAQSLAGHWSRSAPTAPGTLAVVVGPEGGVSPEEIELFAAHGAVAVSLGSNILRTSTAGPAAISVLNHLAGRW
ncbi:16S rRNA (uracil1498-N3)-methyltransferase [Arthrobacter pigmenti]|uniref:Ribosomal RNA small subunit methyltransferase E n=1 Tax=Arthrobacter pigmenti TaxID=271432 RepID=A0A846RQH6_9MICC|nr:16S rRNA (uracil(1498)-N(3))-methyltransferase [Arthrobacter pigmenti]NJC22417.1 16S rRNA (uracil1498-N3)-methyltransferase [Arthrobacter pigmenti]